MKSPPTFSPPEGTTVQNHLSLPRIDLTFSLPENESSFKSSACAVARIFRSVSEVCLTTVSLKPFSCGGSSSTLKKEIIQLPCWIFIIISVSSNYESHPFITLMKK